MVDGSEDVFAAGDVMMLPPGHDAWTIGEEACEFIEFSSGTDDYYASPTPRKKIEPPPAAPSIGRALSRLLPEVDLI